MGARAARGVYHGAQSQQEVRSAAEAWSFGPRGDGRVASGGGAFDVVIACYSIFERDSADSKEKRAWLRSLNYSHLVLDEAHLVKNRQTQRARRLDAVATKARRRVLLTGTPLQNNLGELESLIHLVLPGLLEEGALGGEDGEDDACELVRAHRLARVKEILRPFILRRLKEDVAKELIPKIQEKRIVEMGESQRRQYAAAVEAARNERRRAREAASSKSSSGLPSDDADSPGGGSPGGGRLTSTKVKALFVHLRKIANHPLLVRERYGDAEVAEIVDVCHRRGVFGHEAPLAKVESHVRSLSDFDLHQLCGEQGHLSKLCLPVSAFAEAAKTAALVKLLDEIKSKGSRPLIFSQWKIVLDILEWVLRDRGLVFVRLDGSTDVRSGSKFATRLTETARRSSAFCSPRARVGRDLTSPARTPWSSTTATSTRRSTGRRRTGATGWDRHGRSRCTDSSPRAPWMSASCKSPSASSTSTPRCSPTPKRWPRRRTRRCIRSSRTSWVERKTLPHIERA